MALQRLSSSGISVALLANAKLNLYLKIVGKKENGYHLLNMINVPISIYDEIEIEITPSKETALSQSFSIQLDCPFEKTTIYKAFNLLKKHISFSEKFFVSIKKNIPTGSGMGGGSSDAAAFIKLVLENFGLNLTETLMTEIANEVGADVPFFLLNKPAFVEGIGEHVTVFDSFPLLNFVIIVPDFAISTKWAYENFKMTLTKKEDDIIIKNSQLNKDLLLKIMDNDLEKPVLLKYPIIGDIKKFLENNGALRAMMTGSGSAVFGVFDDEVKAEEAYLASKSRFSGYKIFNSKTIGV